MQLGDKLKPLDQQTECVRVEYFRRYSIFTAAISALRPLWKEIHRTSERLKALRSSKWRRAEIIFLLAGIIVDWILRTESRFELTAGFWLIALAAVSHAAYRVDELIALLKLAQYSSDERILTAQAACSGVPSDELFQFNKFFREQERFEERDDSEQSEEDENRLMTANRALWSDAKHWMLESAIGTYAL